MPENFPARVLALGDVVQSPSMFSDGTALWVDGTEIAHFDSDGALDLRLTRKVIGQLRPRLREDPRVSFRRSPSSDWIELRIAADEDEELLVELVSRAAEAHRPPPGARLRPPPSGAALARRRRFH